MKCREVRLWLLTARAQEPLPADLSRHLDGCPRCRRRQEQLARIDEQMRRLTPPPSDAAAGKAGLWRRLDQAPRRPPRRLPWRLLAAALAASLLLGLGLGLGWMLKPAGPAQSSPPLVQKPPAPDAGRPLASRLAEQDVRLAAALGVEEQFTAFGRMADALQAEAFRLAREGARDELTLAADLYGLVVRRGLASRVGSLPAGRRAELTAGLVGRLQATQTAVERQAEEALPAVAELLRPLGTAARDAAAAIQADRPAAEAPRTPAPGAAQPLLTVLVVQGLRLAEEEDPLRRADLSAELAHHLSQAVVLLAAGGDADQASDLSASLGELMDVGVAENLDRAEKADVKGARRAEAEQVQQRASQAVEALKRNLAHAPEAARAGLERALKASAEGWERSQRDGGSKGKPGRKGPPWLRGDKDAPPPGEPPGPPGQKNNAAPGG
jgi:hypothetical protein